jgi:hypothetical protein
MSEESILAVLKRLWQVGNQPLVDLPEFTHNADDSGLEKAGKMVGNFGSAVAEGFTSPIGLATAALGGGAAVAGAKGMLGISRGARLAEAGLTAPFVAEGVHNMATADSAPQAVTGAIQAGLGAFGVRNSMQHAFPPKAGLEAYMRSQGRTLPPLSKSTQIDESNALRISDARQAMPHAPNDGIPGQPGLPPQSRPFAEQPAEFQGPRASELRPSLPTKTDGLAETVKFDKELDGDLGAELVGALRATGFRPQSLFAVAGPAAAMAVPDDDDSSWDEFARAGLVGAGIIGMAGSRKRPVPVKKQATLHGTALIHTLDDPKNKLAWEAAMVQEWGPEIQPALPKIYANAQKAYQAFVAQNKYWGGDGLRKMGDLLKAYDRDEWFGDWYVGVADDIGKKIGKRNLPIFMKIVAATSTQKSPEQNLAIARQVFAQWKAGTLTHESVDKIKGLMENTKTVLKEQILDAPLDSPLKGRKTNDFWKALMGDQDVVVVDRWMVRALDLKPTPGIHEKPAHLSIKQWERLIEGKTTAAEYDMVENIVRMLAKEKGVSPVEVQASLWKFYKSAAEERISDLDLPYNQIWKIADARERIFPDGIKGVRKRLGAPLYNMTLKNGGATFDINTGIGMRPSRYAVAIHPERSREILGEPSLNDISRFIFDNADLLESKQYKVGTWIDRADPDNPVTYLDLSILEGNPESAAAIGKALNQKSVYSVAKDHLIPTAGDGRPRKGDLTTTYTRAKTVRQIAKDALK